MILEGDSAVSLWLKGRDAWNEWVRENPNYSISFKGINFPVLMQKLNISGVSFKGFHFPIGEVNFNHAKFGEGAHDFSDVVFNDGDVLFVNTEFGGHMVNFSGSTFGVGEVRFVRAKFLNTGHLNFLDSKFGEGDAYFDDMEFDNWEVTFQRSRFGNGKVSYKQVQFGKGCIDFREVKFGEGVISFNKAYFNGGDISFYAADFGGEGHVIFNDVKFGNGDLLFRSAGFGSCKISFEKAQFGRHTDLSLLNISEKTKSLCFRNASFEGSMEFSTQSELTFIPDFVGTSTTHHISLHGLLYSLQTKRSGLFRKAVNKSDGERLCRLKEIADNNKERSAALRFHADEHRAKRWHQMNILESTLDLCYEATSNYGQSIIRPMIWFVILTLFFTGYLIQDSPSLWPQALALSLSKAIPFLGGIKSIGQSIMDEKTSLCSNDFISIFYAGFSFAFIFLIGLGIRNRFKL